MDSEGEVGRKKEREWRDEKGEGEVNRSEGKGWGGRKGAEGMVVRGMGGREMEGRDRERIKEMDVGEAKEEIRKGTR